MSKVTLNENKEIVERVKAGLEKKGGYCPCRLQKNEDTKCICKEFREQIADPDFEGYCHCRLYYKTKSHPFGWLLKCKKTPNQSFCHYIRFK